MIGFCHWDGRPAAAGRYRSTSDRLSRTRPPMARVENFLLRTSFAIACRLTFRIFAAVAWLIHSDGSKLGCFCEPINPRCLRVPAAFAGSAWQLRRTRADLDINVSV